MKNNIRNIVLLGHMGSGKSTIGKALARKLSYEFIDTDQEIEKYTGTKISNIFQEVGEQEFRKIEERSVSKLLNASEKRVIAIGGGTFENKKIKSLVLENDLSIWLKCNINILVERLKKTKHRPLLIGKNIKSDSPDAEFTNTNYVTSFNSDGFTINNDGDINGNNRTYASWNWKANGAGSANTAGSINSTVSVNTTAGFSIVKYTGNASAGATVGHGLGAVPKMIIVKNLNATKSWQVYHSSLGASKILVLDTTAAQDTAGNRWNNTAPTNTVFTLGNADEVNGSVPNIAYCFADVQGYSKFSNYTGNGNADGTFVYTGFKPAFVMVKRTDATADWFMFDNKRNTFNPQTLFLKANLSNADGGGSGYLDMLSNGFKWRASSTSLNTSGGNYIYMAFAEAPLIGSNNVPATAR